MGVNLDFVSKLYNNRNSYADVFTEEEIRLLNVESSVEELVKRCIEKKKIIFITGNPGDGKTHLIKSLDTVIRKNNAYVIKDINEIKDYELFLIGLKDAIHTKSPAIIAINEYPFIDLLEKMGNRLPYYEEIIEQRNNSIIYNNDTKDIDLSKVIVIDLNNRNLLTLEMVRKILKKVLRLCSPCDTCANSSDCKTYYNIKALKNELVQERLLEVIDKLGSSGIHIVMRDILGFFSFIIAEGKKCNIKKNNISSKSYLYYDLVYRGNNELFNGIKQFDPYNYTHPEIDESLWMGKLSDGWIFAPPKEIPEKVDDTIEAARLFKSIKRKFYFENIRGKELLKLVPDEYKTYYNLVNKAYDREDEIKQRMILAINRYFYPNDTESDKLKIWITHKYELSNYHKVAVTSQSFSLIEISILIPNLPKHLAEIDYAPNHFLLRVENLRENKKVDLKIDLGFFRILSLVNDGYPSRLVPEHYQFKLYRFMNELGSLRRGSSNEFFIRDINNINYCKVSIRNNKYMIK